MTRQPPRNSRQPRRQSGFSLVELMIAATLGLLLTVAMGYAYVSIRQSYRTTEVLSRIQENARFAFERMGRDIRMAGAAGCSYATCANTLDSPDKDANCGDPAAWQYGLFGRAVGGYEAGVSSFPSAIAADVVRGDALAIVHADDSEFIVDSHNASAASIHLKQNHDLKQGDILLITDCQHAAVFQMTNVNNNDNISVVDHGTGNSVSPGNCTKGLGSPVVCTTLGTPFTFPEGSKVMRVNSMLYYVGQEGNGNPALFRRKLAAASGNSVTIAEELVSGVEDMQILYGLDTTGDQAVDDYVTADAVGDWSRVLTVRVSLLMVSVYGESITTEAQTYRFNGTDTTPTDRLLRKSFTTTFAVRNRL